jgi:hypothetical protein
MNNLLDAPVKASTNCMEGYQIIQYFVQNNFSEEINGILTIQDEIPIAIYNEVTPSKLVDEGEVFHNYLSELKILNNEFFAKVAAHLVTEWIDITDVTFTYFNSITIPSSFPRLTTNNDPEMMEFSDGDSKFFSYEQFTTNNCRG